MILACTCESSAPNGGQDAIHGKGRRVHNPCGKSGRATGKQPAGKPTLYRCTVCLREKDVR